MGEIATDTLFQILTADGTSWTDVLVNMVEWAEKKYADQEKPEEAIAKDFPTFNDLMTAYYQHRKENAFSSETVAK